MKYIKMLTAALLVASTTQAFAAADALADQNTFATKLLNAGIKNPGLITNETLLINGYKKTLGLARVRAAFVAGATAVGRDGELTITAAVVAPVAPPALNLADGTVDIHGTALASHADVVAGLQAKTHAVVNLGEHRLSTAVLTGLRAGTHVVADDAAIQAENAAKVKATNDLAALTVYNTALRAAAANAYMLVPAAHRPSLLRQAYTNITDADALITVQAVAALQGGNIQPLKDDDSAAGVALDAATFLAGLNATDEILDFDVTQTLEALHAAHDGANKNLVDALEHLALAYADITS